MGICFILFLSADQLFLIALFGMNMFFKPAENILLLCESREDQCSGRSNQYNECQQYCSMLFQLMKSMIRLLLKISFGHSVHLYNKLSDMLTGLVNQDTLPNADNGQIRKKIFPTICSSGMHPTCLSLESTELSRSSPIMKYCCSGT